MSLFTAALGGAGRAAGQMAEAYIKDELTRNAAADLERIRTENEERKARLINELAIDREARAQAGRLETERAIADYRVSPEYVDRAAAAAGKIKGAESDATAYTLNPGDQRRRGADLVAENERPTNQEVVRDYGSRSERKAERKATEFKAIDAWVKAQRDSGTAGPHVELGGAIAETLALQGLPERQAIARAQQTIANALKVIEREPAMADRVWARVHQHFGLAPPEAEATAAPAGADTALPARPRGPSLLERVLGGDRGGESTRAQRARAALDRFGLRQRRDDPEGYRAAQEELRAALAEARGAETEPTPEELEAAARPALLRRRD